MAAVNKLSRVVNGQGGLLYTNVGGTGLANGEQSQPLWVGHCRPEKAWQVTGTFGAGGSIQVEASLDGSNWVIVGVALTAAGFVAMNIPTGFIRFNVTAGDGTTSLAVSLYALPQRGS